MSLYYDNGIQSIHHGDVREILPQVGEFDLGLTDPPYNHGIAYDLHDDRMERQAYQDWCAAWYACLEQACRKIVIFPGHGNLDIWWAIKRPSAIGCWYKPGNPSSSHLGWCEWEPYLYWGQRVGGSDVLNISVSRQPDTGDHPCPKPLRLMTTALRKFKPASVVDPFLGSGTTLLAAKLLGIPGVGIEISEHYCELAALRLERAPHMFDSPPPPALIQSTIFAEDDDGPEAS